jgi:hypothetical protein
VGILNSVWIFSDVARRVETPGPSHEGHPIDLLIGCKLESIKQVVVCRACVGYQRWGKEEWAMVLLMG